jgi:hypothetical protein
MATYVSASVCEDCKIVFPNQAVQVEGNPKWHREKFKLTYAEASCPECEKGCKTSLYAGYWIGVSHQARLRPKG